MRVSVRLALFLACAFSCSAPSWAREPEVRIILIGGPKSEGPARHDYPAGIRLLKELLESSPDIRALGERVRVEAYPDGWPRNGAALDGAATIVWYFDGLDQHPLRDARRRAEFEAGMRDGRGLVALHQSSTVPADDKALDLGRWLGAARFGMQDRVTDMVSLELAAKDHPVSRGLARTRYHDELFPTFRSAEAERGVTPILDASAGGKTFPAAWALERADTGRAFAFSGAHYLLALDQPVVRRMILNAIFWTARLDVPKDGVRSEMPGAAMKLTLAALKAVPAKSPASIDSPTFHRDPQRTGWNAAESILTPANVAGPSFGLRWESPALAAIDGESPRLYASPLYVDRVKIGSGAHQGGTFAAVFAATSTGFVYAIAASTTAAAKAGTILWRRQLGAPCRLAPRPLDGVATGVLATPVIDIARRRLYVTSCVQAKSWQAFALDLGSGEVVKGWPVALDETAFNALNRNAGDAPPPARAIDYRLQRGALNLSPDGALLYVAFGESATGWLVSVDTAGAKIASAFATVANPHRSSGGIWGAGGPAVDAKGNVFVVTGTNYGGYIDQPHDWVQSVLMLSASSSGGFALHGTYTPFNHCETATYDIDLGSGGALLVPDLDSSAAATPKLMAFGGKQGNVYLVDRERMPGRLDRRPPCGADASADGSLLPPEVQPQFARRGPLNVFGPYSETDGAMDVARGRSVPAYFRDAQGAGYLFVTGNTRKEQGSAFAVAPALARLAIVATPGQPAHLRIDQRETSVVLENPGSPVVTSNGSRDAIVWVLDENARRTASLAGNDAPRPVLYAFDAMTLKLLWRSRPGELHTSGKYNEPAVARGSVFVGTDRIQAFGLGP